LIAHDVSCWRYSASLDGGYIAQVAFNKSMKRHDRMVFICSRQSLAQPELRDLLVATLERERDTGAQKLFPVTVDDFILSDALLQTADERLAAR